jgi:SPP1 family predicted phage head-tail adaptor
VLLTGGSTADMERPLRAGDLRESIIIEQPDEVTNDYGETTASWSIKARRRAAVRGLRVDELMSAQGPYTVATHEVEFRYVAGLTNAMRLIWTSRSPIRTLDIVSVTEVNNREYHRLVVKEQVG